MAKRKTKAEKEAEKAEQPPLEAENTSGEKWEADTASPAAEPSEDPAKDPESTEGQPAALEPRTYRKSNGILVRHN